MFPLEGIKVMELATWVAGPSCATILADCGADVVKVEHLETGGDATRGWQYPTEDPTEDQANYVFQTVNRGKRSLALDLRQEDGRRIFHQLARETDVFITNLRHPTVESLNIDYATLSAINPRLIYGRVTGYGPRGPDRDRFGYDVLSFWARSGLMAAHGERGGPPVLMHGSLGDITTGTFLFSGLVLALYERERTGKGCLVDASLLGSGAWVAAENLWSALFTGKTMSRHLREGPPNPLVNFYRGSDGKWLLICILQMDRHWHNFCQAIVRPDLEMDPRFDSHERKTENSKALVAILDEVFGSRPVEYWGRRFDQHRIAWAPVNTAEELSQDPQMEANDYIVEVDHPVHGRLRETAVPFQLNERVFSPRTAAPEFGDATEEILMEHGYTWEQIASLKDRKVII